MEEDMMTSERGYGKKPAWFWIVMYLMIGGAVYALYYYYAADKAGYTNQSNTSTVSSSPSSTNSAANPTMIEETKLKEHQVEITAAGYSPSMLTIGIGDTVTWTNTSEEPSNVSSDPHPEHTTYTPLNLGMFKPGASESLTFDTAGTYTYHNHFDDSQTGTIIVK